MMEDWQKNIPVEFDQNRGTTLQLHDPQVRQKLGRALLDDKTSSFVIGDGNKRVSFDLGASGNSGGIGTEATRNPSSGFNASSR